MEELIKAWKETVNKFMELRKRFIPEDYDFSEYKDEHDSTKNSLGVWQVYVGECVTTLPIMIIKGADDDELMRITVMYHILLKSKKLRLDFKRAWSDLKIEELRDKYTF